MSLKLFPVEWLPRTPSGASENITLYEGHPMDGKKRRARIEYDYGQLQTRDSKTMRRHTSCVNEGYKCTCLECLMSGNGEYMNNEWKRMSTLRVGEQADDKSIGRTSAT
jgi:hypothetical protein